jgi:hypothetical protein
MLTELAADRANMNTAANPACLWLFPGGRAGQPLTPGALVQQFRALGVAATQTRTAAFRQLVLQPPPRSSRAPSATAPEPPPATSSPPAEPGTVTRPPTPGAERGTETIPAARWSRFPIQRTRNDRPQGRAPPR